MALSSSGPGRPGKPGKLGFDKMKYFVYILQSQKDHKYYIGQTSDIERRVAEHNRGKVKSTKHRSPFKIIYFDELDSRIDAIRLEKYYKSYKNTKDLLSHLKDKSFSPLLKCN